MRTHWKSLVFSVFSGSLVLALPACGGGGQGGGAARTSGQSALMDKTFAGANKCSPKTAERPFVIEWDATDMSSFEARTSSDVVFVKYEGCDLKILDSCVNDSVKGSLGSYKPVEWTAGSVEVVEIANEGELYAKLPLGVGTLGGRVSGGEKFRMEYFVSGTRNATRDAVHAKDLEKIAGCKGATHFVYGYNLGAFALGSQSKIKGETGGSVYGIGVGGSRTSENKAEKNGGLLSSCRAETAKEVQTCKVPIRLTLREISPGDNPDAKAAKAPETPDALSLAAKLKAETDKEKKAAAHYETASEKMRARDGKGCLAELDEHDKLDPRPGGTSTNPKAWGAQIRAQCVMLAGQCDAGKSLARKAYEATLGQGPETVDRMVETAATSYCQGKISQREELLQAAQALGKGAFEKTDGATCAKHYATVKRLAPVVKPKDADDMALAVASNANLIGIAPKCFAKAGDCAQGFAVAKELEPTLPPDAVRGRFEALNPGCKGK